MHMENALLRSELVRLEELRRSGLGLAGDRSDAKWRGADDEKARRKRARIAEEADPGREAMAVVAQTVASLERGPPSVFDLLDGKVEGSGMFPPLAHGKGSAIAEQSSVIIASAKEAGELLSGFRPDRVLVFDPDLRLVRQVEVYQAENPDAALRVYFLWFEDSVEHQQYLTLVKREKEAFESLIKVKARMVVPADQEGREEAIVDDDAASRVLTEARARGVAGIEDDEVGHSSFARIAAQLVAPAPSSDDALVASSRRGGGRAPAAVAGRIIVDMREFRSSLPSFLHQRGLRVLPATLEVGDYVLSPEICVERKSLADLLQSFATGRLFNQLVALSRHYRSPVLLIEFDADRPFSLESRHEMSADISSRSAISKLVLVTLHFPRVRMLWSHGPHNTAALFAALKKEQAEPDLDRAVLVGAEGETGHAVSTLAQEILRALPGVTDHNVLALLNHVKNLQELCQMPLEALSRLIGQVPATKLHAFLHADLGVL